VIAPKESDQGEVSTAADGRLRGPHMGSRSMIPLASGSASLQIKTFAQHPAEPLTDGGQLPLPGPPAAYPASPSPYQHRDIAPNCSSSREPTLDVILCRAVFTHADQHDRVEDAVELSISRPIQSVPGDRP
jgi:hypothetical protein